MFLYISFVNLLSFGLLLANQKGTDNKVSSSPYNQEWQAVLKSYLPENTSDVGQDSVKKSSLIKSTRKILNNTHTFSKRGNHTLDSTIVKKSNIRLNKNEAKKDIVLKLDNFNDNTKNRLKLLQTLRESIDHPDDNYGENIGKPVEDSETYQPIGDGIYLMRTLPKTFGSSTSDSAKAKVKTITDKLPDTTKNLGAIIGNLDEEDKDILDANKRHHDANVQSIALENDLNSASHRAVPSADENIEGVQPKELNLISDIQNNLSVEDKVADKNLNEEVDAVREDSNYQVESGQTGLLNIAKAVQESDKDFIKNNPLVIDPEEKKQSKAESTKAFIKNELVDPDASNAPTIPMYKKDQTNNKPTAKKSPVQQSEAARFIARLTAEDNDIKNFAGSKDNTFDLDKDTSLDQRAKDIVNFAAQEDAQIMVGGSRSHKRRRRKRRRHRIRMKSSGEQTKEDVDDINDDELLKIAKSKSATKKISDTVDDDELRKIVDSQDGGNKKKNEEATDTGFFMTDENDIASLNKNTEDFVSNTVNASLVDIIESSKPNTAAKKDNLTDSDDNVEVALNTLNPDDVMKNSSTIEVHQKPTNHKPTKKKHHKKSNHKQKAMDKEDLALYKTLNKTGITKVNRHHSGSVWKVSKALKPTKVINVAGKEGVQIDLYITGNKGKKIKKKIFIRKHNTPKNNIQVANNFNTDTESSSQPLNDAEDVSLNEIVKNQEKEMFGAPQAEPIDVLQTNNHLEGNEGKQTADVNLQDTINSEELKSAMTESDLKGLNAIKSELDLQDAKNTVDFFNQPSTAKSLAHHIESTNIGDLNQQIKDAETEAFTNSADKQTKADTDPQKVKIILHIPEAIAKQKKDPKTQETINSIAQQAKAFLSTDQLNQYDSTKDRTKSKPAERFDDATLAAAKKIEEFIKQEASKEDEEDKDKEETSVNEKKESSSNSDSDVESSANILSALLKASNSLGDPSGHSLGDSPGHLNDQDNANAQIPSSKYIEQSNLISSKQVEGSKPSEMNPDVSKDPVLPFHSVDNPHPTSKMLETFIKTTHEQALSKEVVKNADSTLNGFTENNIFPQRLQINGGKVLGGNVRGGSILGGVVSGGDVAGGEIRGGLIKGGTFKNGLFVGGVMENGVVEGGKIKGGRILGGDIKSGEIDGGIVKGGIIEGGQLINGSVEGGDFKGGKILGGKLLAGEMDGGLLKNGTINGGVLKGGVIESGSLDGGLMLSGTLRGGVVKSGVIKGGIIDKGVIVQDAEIGPGVEIHDGIVKGGRITVNTIPQVTGVQEGMFNSPVPEAVHTDENRSNIMYTLQVLPKPTDSFRASVVNGTAAVKDALIKVITPSDNSSAASDIPSIVINDSSNETAAIKPSLTKSLKEMDGNDIEKQLSNIVATESANKKHSPTESHQHKMAVKNDAVTKVVHKPTNDHIQPHKQFVRIPNSPKQSTVSGRIRMKVHPDNKNIQKLFSQLKGFEKPIRQVASNSQPANRRESVNQPAAHWELTEAKNNVIKGNPGSKLRISGGVRLHNGHAILDGVNGYMDAGDYQGECFSDPEACETGFTMQMTLKVYRDSVFNTTRLFIIDSGAWSKDSRGISIYVSDGRIGGIVVTRDQTWCIHKILEPYIEKWMTLTITWRKDKGILLYINCELFDQSLTHSASECDQCTSSNCHKTDVATRLMFGRPNKGPHFKVIHMAVGEISLYETFSDKEDVKKICGSKDDTSSVSPAVASIIQQPSKAVTPISSFIKPHHQNDEEGGYGWPTPATLKSRKLLPMNKNKHAEAVEPWPTPFIVGPPASRVKPTAVALQLVDPNTDRRSSVHDSLLDGGYSHWMEWSPCSQSCGKGVQISVRYCTNPPPKPGGKNCYSTGPPRKFRSCDSGECPESRPLNDYGTKKSSVPDEQQPMIIVNGQQKSLQELETAFEQLKHKKK